MNSVRKGVSQLALGLAFALSASMASAAVMIDDFLDGSSTFFNNGLSESQDVQAGTMIGGGRFDGMLCYYDCYYSPPYASKLTVGAGSLDVTPPAQGLVTTRVLWGNASLGVNPYPFASLGLNLSGDTAFELSFNSISADLLVQFVVVSSAGQSVYGAANNPGIVLHAGGPQTVQLPFSAFVGVASFSNVSGFGLVLGGNNGYGTEAALAGFSLDSVKIVGAAAAVPEPATRASLTLGLMSLGGLFSLRQRRTARAQ